MDTNKLMDIDKLLDTDKLLKIDINDFLVDVFRYIAIASAIIVVLTLIPPLVSFIKGKIKKRKKAQSSEN